MWPIKPLVNVLFNSNLFPAQGCKVKACPLIWVTWSVMQVLWNIGYGTWIFVKYTHIDDSPAVYTVTVLGTSLPFIIYFILVAIAYVQEIREREIQLGFSSSMRSPQLYIPNYRKVEDMPPPYAHNRPV